MWHFKKDHATENKNNRNMNRQIDKFEREEFRSRYSLVLIIIVLTPMIFTIYNFIQKPNYHLLISLFIIGFVLFIVSGIRYIIVGNRLIFKTWFVHNGEINISSIEKIERTYLPLSSNAGSLKRLGCKLKKGSKYPFLLISPKNEERFLERLKQVNPTIEIKVDNKKGFYRFWDWDI